MKKLSILKLYLIFVKIGAILLGGGYVILPILTSELCEKRNLIDKDKLVDYFAISQSLPGIVATNISMLTGYKLRRILGAIVAMLGIITIPFWCIVFLASIFEILTENLYINGIFRGVGVAVIALILLTSWEIWQKSEQNKFFYIILILSLISLLIFNLSPIVVIVIFTLLGILIKAVNRREIK